MTTHTRRTLWLCAAPLPVLALALWHAPRAAGDTVSDQAHKKLRVALVANNASDYWIFARKGGEQAARKAGVQMQFKMPASGTAAEQVQIVDDLLAQHVDAITISPVDAANQGDMLNRAARKVLAFTFDSDAPQSNRACYIGTDNVAAGRRAGQEMKRALPRGGQIMLFVGKYDTINARERVAGIRQALRGSRVRVLGVMTDDTDRARAVSNVTEAMQQHPRIRGMIGLWSYNGPAILSALQRTRKVGRVKVVAFDDEDDTLDGVQSGYIRSAIVQQPEMFGRRAVEVMAQVLVGNRKAIPASKKIFIPTRTINKSNLTAFRAYHKKMLGH